MEQLGQQARKASRAMARADSATRNRALTLIADAIERDADQLRAANQLDMDAAAANGLAPAMLDRLALSDKAIATMVEGLRQIVALSDPIGEISVRTSRSMRRGCASRAATPPSCAAARKRSIATAPWQNWSRKAWPAPACPKTACKWSTPPTAPPSVR
jgi:hypothetical protein